MMEFKQLPPLSLYIHIPWCIRKCPYCDFNSHEFEQAFPETEYINAMIEDLDNQLPSIWGRRITSIFIGGGTPSLFSVKAMDHLLSAIRSRLSCLPGIEITLEANPGTAEQTKFSEFKSIGINRLSLGVQSFNDDALNRLGRIHNASDAIAAVEMAQQAGFDQINIDLMFGLPEQNLQTGLQDLNTAIALQPGHLSWYQLTIEPNTFFYSHIPVLPDEENIDRLQVQGQSLLDAHGFQQYEVSAYARQGKQCQHNLNYWLFGDYLALGAGAHGKISRSDNNEISRYWKLRDPKAYIKADASAKTSGTQQLTEEDVIFEFMLNALRLKDGFSRGIFETHTGLNANIIHDKCEHAIAQKLLIKTSAHYQPTELGYRFLNNLINIFNPDAI